jgi:hypothetical protein
MGFPLTSEQVVHRGRHMPFPFYAWFIERADGPVWQEIDEKFEDGDRHTGPHVAFFVDPFVTGRPLTVRLPSEPRTPPTRSCSCTARRAHRGRRPRFGSTVPRRRSWSRHPGSQSPRRRHPSVRRPHGVRTARRRRRQPSARSHPDPRAALCPSMARTRRCHSRRLRYPSGATGGRVPASPVGSSRSDT